MKPGPKRRIRIDPETGCHVPMKRARCATGYPQYKHEGRHCQAARVVWMEQRGPIPDGLQVDHLCRNRECVNIDHLELVTQVENVRRSRVARLTMDQVREIRASTLTGVELAKRYGVSQGTISLARNGHTWREAYTRESGPQPQWSRSAA